MRGSTATFLVSSKRAETRKDRVYLKAWDERDHHSLILRPADQPGMDFFAFKVSDAKTLLLLVADLRDAGVRAERLPAGDLLATGERFRFEVPTGHLIEIYAEKEDIGNGLPYENPAPWTPAAEHGIAPTRMDHCLLVGPDPTALGEIFTGILGFYVTERLVTEDGKTDLGVLAQLLEQDA